MDWRGTGAGLGASDISVFLFFGGVLMNVAGLLEVSLCCTLDANCPH